MIWGFFGCIRFFSWRNFERLHGNETGITFFGCIRYFSWKNFERLHGKETGIANVGIGRVMSLFSSSVVGVNLSCLFYRYFIVKSSVVVSMVRFLHY
jgi:hypothetical protein